MQDARHHLGRFPFRAAQARRQIDGAPFEETEISSQRQRAGTGSAPAGNEAMVVVLAAPGDEVALRVGGGEALGGDRVFHHVGASERGQRQVTVQPEARFEAHQVTQWSQAGFGVRNALTPR